MKIIFFLLLSFSAYAQGLYVASRVFAIIYPEKKEEFISRGEAIAWDRVIGGVHHLDLEALK